MADKLTQKQFIEKAVAAQGDRYSYDHAEYLGAHTPVLVTCAEHGDFPIRPASIYKGRGCGKCAGRGLSDEEHVARFRKVHGSKYDYSKFGPYKTAKTKYTIICPEHGEFFQSADGHLKKGCGACSIGARTLTTEEFVRRAREKHGDKYDYSEARYVNGETDVTIICPTHGKWAVKPQTHLKYGCARCSGVARYTTEEFINRSRAVHGDRYDYSKAGYQTNAVKVMITCKVHGDFEQRPMTHLKGSNCPKCAREDRVGKISPRRLTTEQFVERAREAHGDRYDYGKSNYVAGHRKLVVSCPEHGDFEVSGSNHIAGKGCPTCGGTAALTTETFIERARELHGDKYDYDKTVYKNGKEKVTITCPIHGDWDVMAGSHINRGIKPGCPQCGIQRIADNLRLTKEKFAERSRRMHGDKYDYSKVIYIINETKVEIICPEHGSFWQIPTSHMLAGSGCKKCGDIERGEAQRLGIDGFVQRARIKHGDKYDYSKIKYVNNATNVTIACPEHGDFEQSPSSHLVGSNCPLCAGNLQLDTATFIEKSRVIHGDAYSYEKTAYKGAHRKVIITCPEHGDYMQTPTSHRRSGCPGCAKTGFDATKPGSLYYLRIDDRVFGPLYKIGITNRSVTERYKISDLDKISILGQWQFNLGQIAADFETEILRKYWGERYMGEEVLASGNSEVFRRDVLGLDPESPDAVDSIVKKIVKVGTNISV